MKLFRPGDRIRATGRDFFGARNVAGALGTVVESHSLFLNIRWDKKQDPADLMVQNYTVAIYPGDGRFELVAPHDWADSLELE